MGSRRNHLVAITSCLAVLAATGAVDVTRAAGNFSRSTATRVATVDVAAIAGMRRMHGGAKAAPFLTPRTAASSPTRGPRPGVMDPQSAPGTPVQSAATAALAQISGFPVMSLDQQITAFGAGQNVTPPDTQLAAGPTDLLETLNDSGSVWAKSGGLIASFDLHVFFHVPAGSYFSDPRVLYDAPTGRWFISGLSFTPPSYGSVVYLAVSSSSEPTGSWTVYAADSTSSVLHDQPKIGVSADKVVMSWNDFQNASVFLGETTYVWQKSQLLSANSTVAIAGVVQDGSRNSLVPAQALVYSVSDTNAYVVYNNSHCFLCSPSIGVLTITGTPLQGNVGWSESDLGIFATSTPPSADQPGAPGSIATNDDRFLSAVVESGNLWTSGNDACVPNGDSTTRPCARLISVSTAGPRVTQDFDLGSAGAGLYYPSVGLDQNMNMLAAYSISSSSMYPGVRVIGESGGSIVAGQTVKAGEALYNDVPCYAGTSSPSRWGDYSSAAVDPSAPADMWLAGEYSAVSTLPATAGCAWGTYTAQVTIGSSPPPPAPTASVSPATIAFGTQTVGTTTSAQTVTVTNTGNAALVVTAGGVTVTDSVDFLIGNDHCSGATLAAGAACTFTVSFKPGSVGTFTATVDIADNAAGSPQTVALSGSGVKRKRR